MLKLALILIAVLAIAACGGDSADQIVGSWKGTYEGETGVFIFGNNGGALLNADGDTFRGTYLVRGNLLELNYKGETMFVTFSINGDQMVCEATYDGDKHTLVLERGL